MTYDEMLKTFDKFFAREIEQADLDEVFETMTAQPIEFDPKLKQVFWNEVYAIVNNDELRERVLKNDFSHEHFRVLALHRWAVMSMGHGAPYFNVKIESPYRDFLQHIKDAVCVYAGIKK